MARTTAKTQKAKGALHGLLERLRPGYQGGKRSSNSHVFGICLHGRHQAVPFVLLSDAAPLGMFNHGIICPLYLLPRMVSKLVAHSAKHRLASKASHGTKTMPAPACLALQAHTFIALGGMMSAKAELKR